MKNDSCSNERRYKLAPLAQMETFTKEHMPLPEIPSVSTPDGLESLQATIGREDASADQPAKVSSLNTMESLMTAVFPLPWIDSTFTTLTTPPVCSTV